MPQLGDLTLPPPSRLESRAEPNDQISMILKTLLRHPKSSNALEKPKTAQDRSRRGGIRFHGSCSALQPVQRLATFCLHSDRRYSTLPSLSQVFVCSPRHP